MSEIRRIKAREVLDSRGRPTVEVDIICADNARGRAIVPSGASTGAAEAHELRDHDAQHYDGLGVRVAVESVEKVIAPELIGHDAGDQASLDQRLLQLDGTPRKERLGANALLGVSLAAAHAAAASGGVPLYRHVQQLFAAALTDMQVDVSKFQPRMPRPMTNMISGGLHAGGNFAVQDVLAIPVAARDFATGLEWLVRIHRRLGEVLTDAGFEGRLVADEGGYGPRLPDHLAAIELLLEAIEQAALRPGADVTLALDVAATHFYDGAAYRLGNHGKTWSGEQMIEHLADLVARFPITSIEDGLAEDDWPAWQQLTARLGDEVQLVGDDLLATQPDRVRRAIESRAANSVLVKVNQVGTLSETFQTMRLAIEAGWTRVVSARSGDTEDTTIADLAVGTAAEMIKIGSVTRSERLAKYNQLLRIEEDLTSGGA